MTKFKYILSAIFVAFITFSFPLMVIKTPADQIISSENRKIVSFPKIHSLKKRELIDFIEKFDKYVGDRIPFKEYVYQNFAHHYKKHTISNDYSRAIEGKNGWLFLGNNYNNVLYQHIKELPLDLESRNYFNDIINTMSNAFPSAYTTVLVCPDKHGIYWEYIPNHVKKQKEYRLAEKKIENLRDNGINVIDLYSALKEAKNSSKVYFQTDTHWNPKGAEAGFREFYRQISKRLNLAKLDYDLYEYETENKFQGDLTSIGGYKWLEESVPVFKPKYKVDWIYNGEKKLDYTHLSPNLYISTNSSFVTNPKAPNKLRVFWCGDSFASSLAPFITLSFENIRYIARAQCSVSNKNFIKDIKEFKPDLIVWETVERDL